MISRLIDHCPGIEIVEKRVNLGFDLPLDVLVVPAEVQGRLSKAFKLGITLPTERNDESADRDYVAFLSEIVGPFDGATDLATSILFSTVCTGVRHFSWASVLAAPTQKEGSA